MDVDVVRGASRKPASGGALADLVAGQPDLSGQLFIGYPIISTSKGPHTIDALLVSPDRGMVIFDLIEGAATCGYEQRQDDSANKLEARLKVHRELVQRRDLLIPIHTISFGPGVNTGNDIAGNDYPIADQHSLMDALRSFTWSGSEQEIYEAALSAVEGISRIREGRTRRIVHQEDSLGARLKGLEQSIATLDHLQNKAVIETVEGVQRIRGLAGSGKTIVLALKAAYLHAQHPEWRIAVTFNTRSLKGQFQRLINNFSVEQTGQEPDWESLRIVNAWGAPGGAERDGIYHEFCRVHSVRYYDFQSARKSFRRGSEFADICKQALAQMREDKQIYDAILVDEAQDFSPAFLRLCYALLTEHKRLIYAYDELQNLTGESLPSPEDLFGRNPDGSPKVRFNGTDGRGLRQDIVLEKCYRNSRPVLVTAHALGFGIYREPPPAIGVVGGSSMQEPTGLVQMFEHPQLWKDIGYQRKDGELSEGSSVTLFRAGDTSPEFLENHSSIDELIRFIPFESERVQADWLIEQIRKNIEHDELRHDDIIVINPDPLTTRDKAGPIRARLLEMNINSHLAGVDTDPDVFFRADEASVTFTGIFRAKGNEAGMVYVINAQDCNSAALNLARIRNRLFTAITRSKAWIRVLGTGSGMEQLTKEYERLKERNFELKFTYPDKEQRKQLRIVHRDMTESDRQRLHHRRKNLNDLLQDLETGAIHPEDLDENMVTRLKALLG